MLRSCIPAEGRGGAGQAAAVVPLVPLRGQVEGEVAEEGARLVVRPPGGDQDSAPPRVQTYHSHIMQRGNISFEIWITGNNAFIGSNNGHSLDIF